MNLRSLLLPFALVLLASCVAIEKAAPPVPLLSSGAGTSRLERGRDIYITKCADCHRPQRITKFSSAEWEKILPPMNRKSKLTPADAEDVRQYVTAVLASGVRS